MPHEVPHPDDYELPTTDELEEMRTVAELTQGEIAHRVGRSDNWWWQLVNYDTKTPTLEDVHAVLDVLREELDDD